MDSQWQIMGDALSVLLLIFIIVCIDTITKWIAIAIQYCNDKGNALNAKNIFRAIFFRAWQKGYLESQIYKWNILLKAFVYLICIMIAVHILVLLPTIRISGIDVGETLAFLIYIFIIVGELFSIAENVKEMGYEQSTLFTRVIETLLMKIGVNYRKEQDDKCDK